MPTPRRRSPPPKRRRPAPRAEVELVDNPIDVLFDRVDIVVEDTTARLVNGLGSFAESLIERAMAARAARPRPARPSQASPPPSSEPRPRPAPSIEPDPRVILGFEPGRVLTRAEIKARQRALAGVLHPDKGGSSAAQQRVNAAAKALLAAL